MRIPAWGVYLMWAASIAGVILLTMELKRRGWPPPLAG